MCIFLVDDDSPEGYACYEQACVTGYNIIKYTDYSKEQCAEACNAHGAECLGFEFGNDHGGSSSTYAVGDCQLQSSIDTEDCDGANANLDFCTRSKLFVLLCSKIDFKWKETKQKQKKRNKFKNNFSFLFIKIYCSKKKITIDSKCNASISIQFSKRLI